MVLSESDMARSRLASFYLCAQHLARPSTAGDESGATRRPKGEIGLCCVSMSILAAP